MDQQDNACGAGQPDSAAKQNNSPADQAPNSRQHRHSGQGPHNSGGRPKRCNEEGPFRNDQTGRQRLNKNTPHDGKDWNSREVRPSRYGNRGDRPADKQQHDTAVVSNEPNSSVEGKMSDMSLNILSEKNCDLFTMPPEYSLAHCVGSDFVMSSGIAVKFRKEFRSVPKLLDQNKSPGQVGFIKHKDRYVYYLVTKPTSTMKPLWEDFEKSVIEWKTLCVEHEVKQIAIPKIGCGRDHLDWGRVKNLLIDQFHGTGIKITVCVIDREGIPEKKWNLKLCHAKHPLSELDPRDCALIFFGSRDGVITPSIEKLVVKYGFESDYKSKKLNVGDLYEFENKARGVHVFGFVVKNRHNDPVSFLDIAKCFLELRKIIKKSGLWYMGIEAFDDPKYAIVTRKVWTVVIDVYFVENIEVHLCWPDNVKEKCWERESVGS